MAFWGLQEPGHITAASASGGRDGAKLCKGGIKATSFAEPHKLCLIVQRIWENQSSGSGGSIPAPCSFEQTLWPLSGCSAQTKHECDTQLGLWPPCWQEKSQTLWLFSGCDSARARFCSEKQQINPKHTTKTSPLGGARGQAKGRWLSL